MGRPNSRRVLWEGITLPNWDAHAFYELYLKAAFGVPSKDDQDRLARQLMILVTANFGRQRWIPSLRRIGLDPTEVAADALEFVYLKLPDVRLENPCPKAFRKYANTMIVNRVTSQIRSHLAKNREVNESSNQGGDPGWLANKEAQPSVDTNRLSAFLRAAERPATLRIWKEARAQNLVLHLYWLRVLWRYLAFQLRRQNTMLSYAELPERLRERIHPDVEHAEVAYQLLKLVRELAGSDECRGGGDAEPGDLPGGGHDGLPHAA